MQRDSGDTSPTPPVIGYIQSDILSADGEILGAFAGCIELGGGGTLKEGEVFEDLQTAKATTATNLGKEGSGERNPLDRRGATWAPATVEEIEELTRDEIADLLRQQGVIPDAGAAKEGLVDQLAVALLAGRSPMGVDIDRVWAAYVAAMNPRRTAAGEQERKIIRAALKEATADELIVCIRSCSASDYHMKRGEHRDRKGGKYNSLGKILKPRPRLGETQRSRIDWWLDREKASGVAGFPSADPAIVGQRQLEVQRGHETDDPETARKAEIAEAWLSEHGIETVRSGAAIPTFRRQDSRGEV